MAPRLIGWLRRKAGEQLMQEKAFVAFKVGLSVSLGTLLSLTPGYAAMWNDPVSLADQVIFTILGGATLTVGDMTSQIVQRLVLGSMFGSVAFIILFALGHVPVAQGIMFFLIVFAFTYIRFVAPGSDTGLTFATLACVYAVDYSFRYRAAAEISGDWDGLTVVDWDEMADLMRAWAFGSAISIAVNLFVLPVKASRLARDRTCNALEEMKRIITWMLPSHPDPLDTDTAYSYTPLSVRQMLFTHLDTLRKLHSDLSWEVGYASSDLNQRREMLETMDGLQARLVSGSRSGPFLAFSPDLEPVVRELIHLALRVTTARLGHAVSLIRAGRMPPLQLEEGAMEDEAFDQELDRVLQLVTERIARALSESENVQKLEELDRVTHCLSVISRVGACSKMLESQALAAALRPRRLQPYILTTFRSSASAHWTLWSRSWVTRFSTWRTNRHSQQSTTNSFVPPEPWDQRILQFLLSPPTQYALKVSLALTCLLSILWSPSTRSFFLSYAVRNSTVPLLLALMPTLGLSTLAWIGQLSGACVGVLWAAAAMRIFQGVGPRIYNVPGLFFFQWILCLAVGHRMVAGPDFFAVTAMNASGIFMNVQWHLTGTPGAVSLPLRLAFMLTTACIAIGFAIPFQLLVFPRHARDQLRSGIAHILRRMGHIAEQELEVSGAAMYTGDSEALSQRAGAAALAIREIKAEMRRQDGLQGLAAVEWGLRGPFDTAHSSEILDTLYRCIDIMSDHVDLAAVGPLDPQLRAIVAGKDQAVAERFADACCLTFWTLGASWELFEPTPCPLPSVDIAGLELLDYLRCPFLTSSAGTPSPSDGAELKSSGGRSSTIPDLGRLWSLTLTLVSQRAAIQELVCAMKPQDDSRRPRLKARPEARRLLTGTSDKPELGVGEVLPTVNG